MVASTAHVFVQAAHQLAGAGGGDEPPRHPWHRHLKSAHETDAVASWRERLAAALADAAGEDLDKWIPCPVCGRKFSTEKAVHGHMRCHPGRSYRGMAPPRQPSAGDLGADGKYYRYVCDRCRAPFATRQALGGHRASHSGKKGCFWYAKQEEEAARPAPVVVRDFDLNELAPEAIQAAQEEAQAEAAAVAANAAADHHVQEKAKEN
uniref:C2H2-type domain-containing protein n=1 Tax=Leersia perrieri TaxID=77586 RepID=A0A0D9WUB7_9ORYZ